MDITGCIKDYIEFTPAQMAVIACAGCLNRALFLLPHGGGKTTMVASLAVLYGITEESACIDILGGKLGPSAAQSCTIDILDTIGVEYSSINNSIRILETGSEIQFLFTSRDPRNADYVLVDQAYDMNVSWLSGLYKFLSSPNMGKIFLFATGYPYSKMVQELLIDSNLFSILNLKKSAYPKGFLYNADEGGVETAGALKTLT